jgi:hypothetical protein
MKNEGLSIPYFILNKREFNSTDKIVLGFLIKNNNKRDYYTIKDLIKFTSLPRLTLLRSLEKLNKIQIIYFNKNDESCYIDINYEINRIQLYKILKDKYKKLYIPRNILFNKDLTSTEKLILSYLTAFERSKKNCFTRNKTILETLGISKSVLNKSIEKFKSLGLIGVQGKNDKYNCNRVIKADLDKIHNYYENVKIGKIETEEVNIETVDNINELKTKIMNINTMKAENNVEIKLPDNITIEDVEFLMNKLKDNFNLNSFSLRL